MTYLALLNVFTSVHWWGWEGGGGFAGQAGYPT